MLKKCDHKSELDDRTEREILEDLYGNCYFCGKSLLNKEIDALKKQLSPSGHHIRRQALNDVLEIINKKAVKFGSKGGKSKSKKKVRASRLNGKKGGRPRNPKV